MKPPITRLLALCCTLAFLATLGLATSARPTGANATVSYGPLQELLAAGFDYGDWYKTQTGYTGNAEYFGAYAMTAITDTLYIGFGTARPGESDGALLASYDGTNLAAIKDTSIGFLTEQGFIDILAVGDTINIPGPDPCCGDDWTRGNFYKYTIATQQKTKYRSSSGLVNVLHDWGVWHDGASTYYMATSVCHESVAVPNDPSCEGQFFGKVFKSTDEGANWIEIGRGDEAPIGAYRTYDIIGFADRLYVTWNDEYTQACGLATSADDGVTWQRIAALDLQITCRARLMLWNGQLLALRHDQAALLAVANNHDVTTYAFPDFVVPQWTYNNLTSDGDGNLYTITGDGRIMRSADLDDWQTVAATDRAWITLAYWPDPDKNWLIAADSSFEHARLFKLDLSDASAIPPPTAPVITASIDEGQLKLDWADGPAGYRVYRSASPYFAADVRLLAGTPLASEFSDDSLGDAAANHFYRVRNADADGNLSAGSNIVGEFDFALTPGG